MTDFRAYIPCAFSFCEYQLKMKEVSIRYVIIQTVNEYE